MKFDIDQIRFDTPGCVDKLFFDSAGASLVPSIVTEKMIQYLEEEKMIGGYRLGDTRTDVLTDFYENAAKLIGAEPEHIAFTYNATDSYARALSSIPFQEGDVDLSGRVFKKYHHKIGNDGYYLEIWSKTKED